MNPETRSHNRPGARDAWIWDRRTAASREVFRRTARTRARRCAHVSTATAGRADAARQASNPPTARTNTTRNASTSASVENQRRLFPFCSRCASDDFDRKSTERRRGRRRSEVPSLDAPAAKRRGVAMSVRWIERSEIHHQVGEHRGGFRSRSIHPTRTPVGACHPLLVFINPARGRCWRSARALAARCGCVSASDTCMARFPPLRSAPIKC
jgi:hypothetical protein